MEATTIHLHTAFAVDEVDPRIFGGFLEHLGRAVYEGVYDPDSPHADDDGFRTDVLEALRGLRFTAMRYPGGNFVSGYHWEDGVGPRDKRPTTLDLAWNSRESNHFGTDEFLRLCRKLEWTPMLAVNLGTGTPEEARNWVEYCNGQPGTRYAEMRAANGSPEPHGVPLWCLGNEMDGPWQMGHVSAAEYASRAHQAASMMKLVDPSIELVAAGSCTVRLPTYMEWDQTVLETLGDRTDYLSLHRYVGNINGDTADFLAVSASIDRQIEEMDAACRFVQAKRRGARRPLLAFDEWNVWYRSRGKHQGEPVSAPPLLEEEYNLEDALVVAEFLNSFIRHADVVKIANLAQIVNVIAPIRTRGEEMLLQTIYHALSMYAHRRDGVALQVAVDGPEYDSPSYGPVSFIDSAAILDRSTLHVFLVNRSLDGAAPVEIRLGDVAVEGLHSAEVLTADEPAAANNFEHPERVLPQEWGELTIRDGAACCELPSASLVALTLTLS